MTVFQTEPSAMRIELGNEPEFDLGGLRVKPADRLAIANGQHHDLQPRVMQVLIALARERPAVVSRDRLIGLCWDGRIVGDDALNRCILALRQLAAQVVPAPFAIETVARVGHRLIERHPEATVAVARPIASKWRLLAALTVILLAAAAGLLAWQQRPAQPSPASIAVLPFRNLSTGDPYFAEGIGEEIRGQLAREPQFRVAGGTSSRQLSNATDIRAFARRLDVDYVLEGSVRTQGDHVRVNADLVRANDGIRLWSDRYEGDLDDIFAIQQQIGADIAGSLQRKLVRAPILAGPLVTNGDAYNLYLTARGLIRTYNRRVGGTAANLLRDAIKLDPGYAPAWASLAEATRLEGALNGYDGFVTATAQAESQARHALRLAPDLAEAHRTLGSIAGYGTSEAQTHLRQAAALEPNSAENMIWLGVAHGAAGEFSEQLAAYRRATQLDPLWFRTVMKVSETVAEAGDRPEAEAIARRGFPKDEISQNLLLGRIAWIFGDFSEAARRWSSVARANSPRWSDTARRSMNDATYAVGLRTGPLVAVPPPNDQRRMTPVWMDAPPVPSVWRTHNRNRTAVEIYRDADHKAAKLMLNAGRTRELVSAYDSATGLLGVRARQPLRVDQLHEAPVVALALRRAGRLADADRLLRQSDGAVRTVYRRGRVPFWFDADTAALWAVQGRKREALSLLERAMGRGWTHSNNSDLPDIRDEPVFFTLRNEPRFRRLRAKLMAHYAREQAETARLHIE